MSVTVADSILADLRRARANAEVPTLIRSDPAGGWVCGSYFYASYRPTFSQRIGELNAAHLQNERELSGVRGHAPLIESRVCHRADHQHRGGVHEYRLVREPEQLRMIG